MSSTRKDGSLSVVCGMSRSGKSTWVKEKLKTHKRQIVFDIKGEYSEAMGYQVMTSLVALADLLSKSPGSLKVAFRPGSPVKEFTLWAKLAFTWCKQEPCAIVAEELSDVTNPGKAPDGWGQVCRQGMGFGAHVFAIMQRPSESDKTCFGNATMLHCCAMVRAADRQTLAQEMDVPGSDVNALMLPFDEEGQPTPGPHFIEMNMRSKKARKGKLKFS